MMHREQLSFQIAQLHETIRAIKLDFDTGSTSSNEGDADLKSCAGELKELLRDLNSSVRPVPPRLHWGLFLSCGILNLVFYSSKQTVALGLSNLFIMIWIIVQCTFIRKIDAHSRALWICLLADVCLLATGSAYVLRVPVLRHGAALAGIVFSVWSAFSARTSMVRYYNTVEPINLNLSVRLTLLGEFFYLQYHFWRIATWKKTGILRPQDTQDG